MLADKMRHVLGTGADVLTAGDASCLMHIGGGLSRLRTGTRTLHLAEVLASTETEATPVLPDADGAGARDRLTPERATSRWSEEGTPS
jgi:L-lactate dehydrogenase complex protein LldE